MSNSQARKPLATLSIVAMLILLGSVSTFALNSAAQPHFPANMQLPSSTAEISVAPENITGVAPGQPVTFNVTLSHSPPISQFGVWVQFNNTVLDTSSGQISYSQNILGSSALVQSECIEGQAINGVCQNPSAPNIVSLLLYTTGTLTTVSDGLLFQITFTVETTGFSQLHIPFYFLGNGTNLTGFAATTNDGFFDNQNCGQGLCQPPHVEFTFSPSGPSIGTIVTFNATASHATNPNAKIVDYLWNWGTSQCPGSSNDQSTTNQTIPHVFCFKQDYLVTLTVTDSYHIRWAVTHVVSVSYVFIDVTFIREIAVDHRFGVLPGTPVHITVGIINNSTIAADGSIAVILDTGKILGSKQFNLTQRGGGASIGTLGPVEWDTSGFPVRAYRIDVLVTSNTAQNVTNDKHGTTYVQLIVPQATGLFSLNLLQSGGLSILVIAAAVVGLMRFRRKPSWETEPLTEE